MRTYLKSFVAALAAASLAAAAGVGPVGAEALAAQAQKAVLVTGASSGIGRRITEVLASKGYFVYAGARSAEDLQALDAIEHVQAVRLDVTRQNEIDAAVEAVRRGGRGLHGVVNNAGVAVLAPMIEAVEDDLLFQFNVNVLGPYRITKAFAPLIIESKGRITTIGSINGIIAGPFSGPYAMSKHAMEAFTDALAAEMAGFGVKVSIVEPGRYQSEMSINVLQRMQEKGRTAEGSRYEAQLQAMIDSFGVDESTHKDPLDVAQAVEHALFDPNPKLRYLVAPVAAQAHAAVGRAMQKVVELNERQAFSLDRDALIKMLDAALARSR